MTPEGAAMIRFTHLIRDTLSGVDAERANADLDAILRLGAQRERRKVLTEAREMAGTGYDNFIEWLDAALEGK